MTDDNTIFTTNVFAVLITVASALIVVFDVLRKTVFLGAGWNYDYPPENLIYDPWVFGLFLLISLLVPVSYRKILELREREFIFTLFILTMFVAVCTFYGTPAKSIRWISPTSGYYRAATFAAAEGPFQYIAEFHSLGTVDGREPNVAAAQHLVEWIRTSPLPGGLRAHLVTYASEITVQKHGLVPPLVVAPVLWFLGPSIHHAAIGSYAVTITLPAITYFGFREYFERSTARFGTLLVASSPAYLIYQRYESVAWDAITAVFIGLTLTFVLTYLSRHKERYLILSGGFYSLALLSKASAGTLLLAIGPLLYLRAGNWWTRLRSMGLFLLSTMLLPLVLIPMGYNFLVQYAFTISRLAVESSSFGADHPAAYLNDPILYVVGPLYNSRLLGVGILILSAGYVLLYITEWSPPVPGPEWEMRRHLALLLVFPLLPYVIALPGRTIARHLLPYLSILGFTSVMGYIALARSEAISKLRFAQITLLTNFAITLVAM